MRQLLSLKLLILAIAGCSGYVEYLPGNRQSAPAELTPPLHHQHHPHEPQHPSLFSLGIDWLADHGGLGQLIANVLIAVFVLPPLGPIICGFVHNCDTYRSHGRQLLLSAIDEPSPTNYAGSIDISRSGRSVKLTSILEQLDAAYDKYA